MKDTNFSIGEICFCYYYTNKHESTEIDLFWCEIISIGEEYAKCKLFFGKEYSPNNRVKGIVNNICILDLVKP